MISDRILANFILAIHFVWAAWMVAGFILAVAGFRWPRLWQWRVFRITHLIGLAATATTPFWAKGLCPLTEWEWQLRSDTAYQVPTNESFIIHWMSEVLFLDVSPHMLSIVTGVVALTTLIIFVLRPPWRSYLPQKP